MDRWLGVVWRRPGWVVAALLALTLAAVPGILDPRTGALRLGVDPSVDRLLPEEDPARVFYERVRRLFGGDETVVVALGADDVFTPEVLGRVARLTRRLEDIDGVHHVVSLSTALSVSAVGDDIEIAPFMDEVPQDPDALARLRAGILANPHWSGVLAARDGRAVALLVYIERMSDREYMERGVGERIGEALAAEAGDLPAWVSGSPHVKALIASTLLGELAFILPATVAILMGVLFAAFRSVRGVLLPLGAIGLAVVWTLGLLGWLGQELNLVTTIVPPLIETVGFAYAMHIVAEYYAVIREARAEEGLTPREAVRRTLGHVGLPVVVTGLTTAAGFLSITLSPISAIQEFGLLALLGVALSVVAALTFIPAVLALLPLARPPEERGRGLLDRAAGALAAVVVARRRAVIAGGLAVLAVALFGMTRIQVATDFVTNFGSDSPIRRDYEAINERFQGANVLQVIVETDVPDAFLEPANLRQLESLQAWLAAQPEVGHVTSIADFVKLMNQALHGDDAAYYAIPDSKRLVSQLLLFGASDETDRLVAGRYRTANLLLRTTSGDSQSMAQLVARIDARLAELPSHLEATATGTMVLLSRSIDALARGQWTSILVAFAVIYLVLAALFTSLRVGLLALFPNFLPIALYFGMLGLTGVTLNPWTSLVACLALGIAVDDTIHYFARFNTEAKRLGDERRATGTALRGLIQPVTFTTVGLCLGFLVLTASDLRSQIQFGTLAAFTLAAAWAVDVTLTPALCAGVRTVTLWDVLSLDLGAEPQRSIPLFEGLSTRQARVVALMSRLRTVPAGARLFAEGEEGRDMYVVLDGSLRVSLARGEGRVDLAKLSRGDAVGEIGLFSARRSTDVDAMSETRLIGFDRDDLERLRRRYPRTAALVYRNLNRIQAERFLRQTRQVR